MSWQNRKIKCSKCRYRSRRYCSGILRWQKTWDWSISNLLEHTVPFIFTRECYWLPCCCSPLDAGQTGWKNWRFFEFRCLTIRDYCTVLLTIWNCGSKCHKNNKITKVNGSDTQGFSLQYTALIILVCYKLQVCCILLKMTKANNSVLCVLAQLQTRFLTDFCCQNIKRWIAPVVCGATTTIFLHEL